MENDAWLVERFEASRGHLRAVAYRMLGSPSEADDAVQEAWLQLSRAGTDGVANLTGWMTTVVARVCLDMLRSRRRRREEPLGPHLPEPVASGGEGADPEHEALQADSVGLALLLVLETLAPAERLAFVLHDLFAVPFDEIAAVVGRSPAAARQLASRARRRVQGARTLPDATWPGSGRSSAPSSPPRARAPSTPSSPCWTPTSSSGPTRRPWPWAQPGRSAGPRGPRNLLGPGPGGAAGTARRRGGGRMGPRRAAARRILLHDRPRNDRRDELVADPDRLGRLSPVVLRG